MPYFAPTYWTPAYFPSTYFPSIPVVVPVLGMLDIVEGDVLTMDSKDVTVKAVGEWEGWAVSAAMLSFMTKTVSTKRAVIGAGKRTAPVTYLTGILATPLYPITPEAQVSSALEAGYELKSTYVGNTAGFLEIIVAVRK